MTTTFRPSLSVARGLFTAAVRPATLSLSASLLAAPLLGILLPACATGKPASQASEDYRNRDRQPMWIAGRVAGVDNVPVQDYNDSTVRLVVTTETDENVNLELGPGWYIEEQGLVFAPEQQLMFRGHTEPDGTFSAHEVRQGDRLLQLRDDDGKPRWKNKSTPSVAPAPGQAPGAPAVTGD